MANTVNANEHRRRFKDVSLSSLFLATDNPSADPLIAGRPKYSIFIQKIIINVTTDAAQSLTFRTNEGTPRVLAVAEASLAVGSHTLFEADEGFDLGDGNDLDLLASGAGVAGSYYVQGFMRPTAGGVMTPAQV